MSPNSTFKGAGARSLADYVLRQIDPLIARRGFGEGSLLMAWREIVGDQLAAICAPDQMKWPKVPVHSKTAKNKSPATLVLRVEPGFGLQVQHLTPVIIDRINAHLGWTCVDRLVMRQEPLNKRDHGDRLQPEKSAEVGIKLVNPASSTQAAAAGAGFADPDLREAIIRLGQNALKNKS
jgi:hypothetical protein